MNTKLDRGITFAAVGILLAFFLPWVRVGESGVSGYELGKSGAYINWAWIVPLLAGLAIAIVYLGGNQRPFGALAALAPIFAFLFGLIRVGSPMLDTLLIGAHVTLFLALMLLACSLLDSRRSQIIATVALISAAGVLVLIVETGPMWTFLNENRNYFLSGVLMTLNISFWAALISFVVGLVIALLRVTPSGGLKVAATAFTEFFRNTPLLVQVMVFYFGLPKLGVSLRMNLFGFEVSDAFAAGTLGLGLYTGAYVAEALRAGLLSIPKGQSEAARSLGLSLMQTLTLVVLPQAVRLVLPPLGNLYSAMLKNSAILSYIGVADLMYQADYVNNRTFRTFEVLTIVVLFYLALTLPMGWLVHWLEQKFNPLRAKTLRLRGARV